MWVRVAACGIAGVLVAAGCTSTAVEPIAVTSTEVPVSTAVVNPSTAAPSEKATTTTWVPTVTAAPTTSIKPVPTADELDDRPGGRSVFAPSAMLVFGSDGVFEVEGAAVIELVSGPVVEALDDLDGGVVFQRAKDDSEIWWTRAGRPDPEMLPISHPEDRVELVGVTRSSQSTEVLYQRRKAMPVGPDDAYEILAAFDLANGVSRDIGRTGGWEHHSKIDVIDQDRAFGRWGIEADVGFFELDLLTGRFVSGPPDDGFAFETEGGRFFPSTLTRWDGAFVGTTRGVDEADGSDIVVIRRYDAENLRGEELARLYPTTDWEPTSLVVHNERFVLSRRAWNGIEHVDLRPVVIDPHDGSFGSIDTFGTARPRASHRRQQ